MLYDCVCELNEVDCGKEPKSGKPWNEQPPPCVVKELKEELVCPSDELPNCGGQLRESMMILSASDGYAREQYSLRAQKRELENTFQQSRLAGDDNIRLHAGCRRACANAQSSPMRSHGGVARNEGSLQLHDSLQGVGDLTNVSERMSGSVGSARRRFRGAGRSTAGIRVDLFVFLSISNNL